MRDLSRSETPPNLLDSKSQRRLASGAIIVPIAIVFSFPVKTKVTPWQVLKQRDFGFFWVSLLFSAIGTQISAVAIAWQVYQITNSPLQLGLTGLFRALPVMILSLPGGVLADRMDRRKLLITTQSLAAILSLTLGALTSAGKIEVWRSASSMRRHARP